MTAACASAVQSPQTAHAACLPPPLLLNGHDPQGPLPAGRSGLTFVCSDDGIDQAWKRASKSSVRSVVQRRLPSSR